jgi:putative redox protein
MIKSHRLQGFSVDISVHAHHLVSDVKPALGGTDLGPDPHEILEAALGACTTMTVQMYADRKGWKLESCDTQIKFIREDAEAIVIERNIELKGELDESQKQRLFEIAEKCPIHKVLSRGVQIQSQMKQIEN